MTDEEVKARLTDLPALAITLDGEGRGEPVEGRIAIGSVIRNRVAHPRRYGRTYRAVCLARGQFSCWFKFGGAANYARTIQLARAFVEGGRPALSSAEQERFEESLFVAEGLIGGQLCDRVRGATHYYAPSAMVPRGRVPDWAAGLAPVATLGRHLFFAGVH